MKPDGVEKEPVLECAGVEVRALARRGQPAEQFIAVILITTKRPDGGPGSLPLLPGRALPPQQHHPGQTKPRV